MWHQAAVQHNQLTQGSGQSRGRGELRVQGPDAHSAELHTSLHCQYRRCFGQLSFQDPQALGMCPAQLARGCYQHKVEHDGR